jgi:hypothetical protein
LSELAARLTEQRRAGVVLGFGGQIFESSPALRERVAALYLGPSAASAIERLESALAQAGGCSRGP